MNQTDATCPACRRAEFVIRTLGFLDSIVWGFMPDSPNKSVMHGSHANAKGLPLCTHYKSELAWVSASRPNRVTVYMAHPIAGDFRENVKSAVTWLRWLRSLTADQISKLVGAYFPRTPLILAPYLAGIEPDDTPSYPRERAIADCRDAVLMFDEMWMVGGRVSDGMKVESLSARMFRDLSHLGKSPGKPALEKQPVRLLAPRRRTRR